MDCERCGRPIPAERLELHPDATLCAGCASRDAKVIRDAGPVDDIRWQREGLPDALRRPPNLYEDD
jgi:hypothetical protein